jgi:hypothetical protein
MALIAGSISMDTHGVVTGSGFAKLLWDDYSAKPTFIENANPRAFFVDLINSFATVVAYVAANAEVTVEITPTDAGLQRTPSPNDASTATLGPSATKTLAGELT